LKILPHQPRFQFLPSFLNVTSLTKCIDSRQPLYFYYLFSLPHLMSVPTTNVYIRITLSLFVFNYSIGLFQLSANRVPILCVQVYFSVPSSLIYVTLFSSILYQQKTMILHVLFFLILYHSAKAIFVLVLPSILSVYSSQLVYLFTFIPHCIVCFLFISLSSLALTTTAQFNSPELFDL